jgi:TPR repeat protein
MTMYRFLVALVILCCAVAAAPAMASQLQTGQMDPAAALYERGDYAGAYKQYLARAKDGDVFAQYRVSYMHAMGLGTRPDAVESLAWAVLAAEGDNSDLDRFQDAVAALVPGKERKKAQKKADYYLRRWGNQDSGGGTLAKNSEGICTGSRLAGNCGGGGSSDSVWISWGQDRSNDPEQKGRIEELNRSILQITPQLGGP